MVEFLLQNRDKVVDFHWNTNDPWTIVSVSEDAETPGGGGTLQVRILIDYSLPTNTTWTTSVDAPQKSYLRRFGLQLEALQRVHSLSTLLWFFHSILSCLGVLWYLLAVADLENDRLSLQTRRGGLGRAWQSATPTHASRCPRPLSAKICTFRCRRNWYKPGHLVASGVQRANVRCLQEHLDVPLSWLVNSNRRLPHRYSWFCISLRIPLNRWYVGH